MLLQTWGNVLTQSFQGLWFGVVSFVPSLIIAIIIFILGWIVGAVLGRVVAQIIGTIRLDKALESAGLNEVLARAGFQLNSGTFIGALIKWFFIIAFLMASLEVLGLEQVNIFIQDVVLSYLPNVIVAALVLLVAAVIADAMQRVVVGSAKAAELTHAHLLGGITRWAIWIFALIIALSHLGVAPAFMQILFTGVVVMLALAGGLAFGLGGKETASAFLAKMHRDISK